MNFSTAELVIIETKARDTFNLVNVDTGTTLRRDAKFLKHASSLQIGNDIDVDISAKTEESIDHSVKRNDPIKSTKPSSKDPEYFNHLVKRNDPIKSTKPSSKDPEYFSD